MNFQCHASTCKRDGVDLCMDVSVTSQCCKCMILQHYLRTEWKCSCSLCTRLTATSCCNQLVRV